MAKWLLKAKSHGVITHDNQECEKGDVFVVETLADNWPKEQDVAKSVGKKWCGSYGDIPHPGGVAKPGEKWENSCWEITRL